MSLCSWVRRKVAVALWGEEEILKLRKEVVRLETRLQKMVKMSEHLCSMAEEQKSQLNDLKAKNHALSESLNKHKQGWMGTLSVAEQLKDQSVTLGQQLDDEKKTARELSQVVEARKCALFCGDWADYTLTAGRCGHRYCGDCVAQLIDSIMNRGLVPARCPGCEVSAPSGSDETWGLFAGSALDKLVANKVITNDTKNRFENVQAVGIARNAGLVVVRCPMCSYLACTDAPAPGARRSTSSNSSSGSSSLSSGSGGSSVLRVVCPNSECRHRFCSSCMADHGFTSCEEWQRARIGDDEETADVVERTSKNCPRCQIRISHYRGHACHHIRPGSGVRGGCPNCHVHFCYVCCQEYELRNGRYHKACQCPLFCSNACDCPDCPDCRPGHPCDHCSNDGSCRRCRPQRRRARPPRRRPQAE